MTKYDFLYFVKTEYKLSRQYMVCLTSYFVNDIYKGKVRKYSFIQSCRMAIMKYIKYKSRVAVACFEMRQNARDKKL